MRAQRSQSPAIGTLLRLQLGKERPPLLARRQRLLYGRQHRLHVGEVLRQRARGRLVDARLRPCGKPRRRSTPCTAGGRTDRAHEVAETRAERSEQRAVLGVLVHGGGELLHNGRALSASRWTEFAHLEHGGKELALDGVQLRSAERVATDAQRLPARTPPHRRPRAIASVLASAQLCADTGERLVRAVSGARVCLRQALVQLELRDLLVGAGARRRAHGATLQDRHIAHCARVSSQQTPSTAAPTLAIDSDSNCAPASPSSTRLRRS
jgi:hypothetical protein